MEIKYVQRRNLVVVETEVLEGPDVTDPIFYSEADNRWFRFPNSTLADLDLQAISYIYDTDTKR